LALLPKKLSYFFKKDADFKYILTYFQSLLVKVALEPGMSNYVHGASLSHDPWCMFMCCGHACDCPLLPSFWTSLSLPFARYHIHTVVPCDCHFGHLSSLEETHPSVTTLLASQLSTLSSDIISVDSTLILQKKINISVNNKVSVNVPLLITCQQIMQRAGWGKNTNSSDISWC
jgi:hypothetical protein